MVKQAVETECEEQETGTGGRTGWEFGMVDPPPPFEDG